MLTAPGSPRGNKVPRPGVIAGPGSALNSSFGLGVEPDTNSTAYGYPLCGGPGTGARRPGGERESALEGYMASRTTWPALLFVEFAHGEKGIVVSQQAFATLIWSVRYGPGGHHDSHASVISSKISLQSFTMAHSIAEILISYAFVTALFVGLPATVFAVVFLPGLMRTTGETIGSSDREKDAVVVAKSTRVASRRALKQPLTMVNTA